MLTHQNKSKLLLSSSWRIHHGLWHGHQLHSLLEVSLNPGSFSLWQYGVLSGLRKQAKPISRCLYQREQAKDSLAKRCFNSRCMFCIAILQSVLGKGWVATDDFQCSLEKHVANTTSEDKPQDCQKFNTRPGNYPCLALRFQAAIKE